MGDAIRLGGGYGHGAVNTVKGGTVKTYFYRLAPLAIVALAVVGAASTWSAQFGW